MNDRPMHHISLRQLRDCGAVGRPGGVQRLDALVADGLAVQLTELCDGVVWEVYSLNEDGHRAATALA